MKCHKNVVKPDFIMTVIITADKFDIETHVPRECDSIPYLSTVRDKLTNIIQKKLENAIL